MKALEELVIRVKSQEPGAMLELWEAVRRFVEMKARGQIRAGSRVPLEDLKQAGFFAMLDAAEEYEAERDGKSSFLSLLRFKLQNRFAEESGVKTTKRDALQFARSADSPAYEDEDGPTVAELVPDTSAALAFTGVEYRDFLDYCRRVISAALDTLPEAQADLLRLHYLEGLSLEEAAPICGMYSRQAASDTEFKALCRLERGKYRRELRECLEAFKDYEAARLECYDRHISRRTEATALLHIEGRKRL